MTIIKADFEVGSELRTAVARRWVDSDTSASFGKYKNRKSTRNFIAKTIEEHYKHSVTVKSISFESGVVFAACEVIDENTYYNTFQL